jgi:ferredoxin
MALEPNTPLGPNKVSGVAIPRPNRNAAVQTYVPEIAKGLALTMKHFFVNTKEMVLGQRNDPVLEAIDDGINCISYPEQRRPYPARFRGVHRLTHRADGSPRCVACLCCSTACPAQCIHIEAGEYPEGGRHLRDGEPAQGARRAGLQRRRPRQALSLRSGDPRRTPCDGGSPCVPVCRPTP